MNAEEIRNMPQGTPKELLLKAIRCFEEGDRLRNVEAPKHILKSWAESLTKLADLEDNVDTKKVYLKDAIKIYERWEKAES